MPGEIVASNDLLRDRAEVLRTFFNSAHAVYLFVNDVDPDPSLVLADFSEATFAGYARKALATEWREVFKVEDGKYQFSSKDLTFTSTAPSADTVYGWMIVGGGKVKFSCRLPFGKSMASPTSLTIRIDCITWAASLL